ncbi:MAG: toxin-antitoxin antitoxin component [Sulfobacillus acidophilus]|uniref:Toxin-antitoxin antitoxin component n=1 Tax=Sulfobacillus acidophilus TaxID=53633 RepID=A0A2T2WG03_9FIRM|nr:MAG: toxin-antitoxin antitoxin component [Sulfobacillus acidophilus]
MLDDVILNKASTIERCVARALEEYHADPATFKENFTRQDAAILNVQRACQAALDLGQHIIRQHKLGIPQSARDVFVLLCNGQWISQSLADSLKKMVGFRNIAVHDYQSLQLPVLIDILDNHIQEFLEYTQAILQHAK